MKIWFALPLVATVVAGATMDDVRQKRTEFIGVCKQVRTSDPSLELDLTSAPLDALGSRVEAAKKKADACSAARTEYLKTVAALAPPNGGATPAPADDLGALITKLQASLVVAIREASRQVESLSPRGETAILREAAQRRRTALLSIQNALVEQSLAWQEAKSAVQSPGQSQAAATALFKEALTAYANPAPIQSQAGLSQQYYAALGDVVRQRKAAAAAAAPKETPAAPPAAEPKPTVTEPAPATRADWLGTWAFSPVRPIYSGEEPVSVEVRIGQQNMIVVGSYVARYKLKPGDSRNPVVKFEFAGPLQSSVAQRFDITGGGTLELVPGDQVLELIWKRPGPTSAVTSSKIVVVRK